MSSDIAIAYLRVSTEDQVAGGVSLTAQREAAEAYVRIHELGQVRVFADQGRSARRADNRPGLRDAVDAACRNKAPLIVHALSRLARSTRDAIEIAERLDRAGGDLISITERVDTTTPMGRFFFTTMSALAQLERDLISQRTAAALAHKRRHHQRVSGQIPFGYDLDVDGVRLLENSKEQAVIRKIRDLSASGLSSRAIICELEKEGLRPKSGGKWHPKVVLSIVNADL